MKMPAREEEPMDLVTRAKAEAPHVEPEPPRPAEAVDNVSGEYAVAEMALELEELGPADEFETTGETVVEVEVAEEPQKEAEEEAPTSGRELVAAPHESARVMVAAPSSSREEEARVDENAPIDLGDFGEASVERVDDEESLAQTHELPVSPMGPVGPVGPPPRPPSAPPPDLPDLEAAAPPSSRRPSSARPLAPPPPPPEPPAIETPVHMVAIAEAPVSAPPPAPIGMDSLRHTDVNVGAPLQVHEEEEPPPRTVTGAELDARNPFPERRPLPTPTPPPVHTPTPTRVEAPVIPISPIAPVGPPEQVAVAVALQAPAAHAARSVEQVVVAIDAVVVKPELTPAAVASMVGAVREARPQTFGALLDAALDL
jgi:hypothetical protein